MTLCKEIDLIIRTQTNHWDYEGRFATEEVEYGGSTSARGASPGPPDKS